MRMGVPLELEGKLDPSKTWEIELTLDGVTKMVTVSEADCVLEAAEKVFDDPPFSCRNGVCTTCSCRIVEGKEGENYKLAVHGLGETALSQGFTMSCQTHVTGPGVKIELNQYDTVYEMQYGQYEKGTAKDTKKSFFGF
eukprot:CAMPEP_0194585408 /NCGR_PEP_ID=MMETSP0292-20121207/17743_1 /TAXON_ID=39354 /ORGANISM="Heterosigma akashiwo, Strain CCMP2393" /LENGTH=138 /DNA_ID=CAMNT_0039440867 /DNA_START=138 /DNA_END=554 /DNA_ORIENTATION=-